MFVEEWYKIKRNQNQTQMMEEGGAEGGMGDTGVGRWGECSGRESDGLNDTCTLGRGWSRTELDHDDWTQERKYTHTHALLYCSTETHKHTPSSNRKK